MRSTNIHFLSKCCVVVQALEPICTSASMLKADFISKLHIALKEANETEYWLELFFESEIIDKQMFDSLNADLNELISLLIASLKTAKNNLK